MPLGSKTDLDSALEGALREALEEIGGASVRDSVIYYLKEKYHIKFERISSNPSALIKALSDIFGVGESLLERKIADKLSERMNLKDGHRGLGEIIKESRVSSEA